MSNSELEIQKLDEMNTGINKYYGEQKIKDIKIIPNENSLFQMTIRKNKHDDTWLFENWIFSQMKLT